MNKLQGSHCCAMTRLALETRSFPSLSPTSSFIPHPSIHPSNLESPHPNPPDHDIASLQAFSKTLTLETGRRESLFSSPSHHHAENTERAPYLREITTSHEAQLTLVHYVATDWKSIAPLVRSARSRAMTNPRNPAASPPLELSQPSSTSPPCSIILAISNPHSSHKRTFMQISKQEKNFALSWFQKTERKIIPMVKASSKYGDGAPDTDRNAPKKGLLSCRYAISSETRFCRNRADLIAMDRSEEDKKGTCSVGEIRGFESFWLLSHRV